MIEDPREVERRRQLGIEDERGCSKEDMGIALQEVFNFPQVCNSSVSCTTLAQHLSKALMGFFLFSFFKVFEGRLPKDRLVLRELTKEMLNWPNLEVPFTICPSFLRRLHYLERIQLLS